MTVELDYAATEQEHRYAMAGTGRLAAAIRAALLPPWQQWESPG